MLFHQVVSRVFANLRAINAESRHPKYFHYRNELEFFKIERAGSLHRLGW